LQGEVLNELEAKGFGLGGMQADGKADAVVGDDEGDAGF
jgi:hypothetical protein